ncbi:hypothetical protein BSKO_02118 [Bryopsis sp. KO-2023]|nr:hypothetical protein BSKO_02118 [Bryopsis sp. KO-2023]
MVDPNLRKSLKIRAIQLVDRELESVSLRIGGFHISNNDIRECETPPITPTVTTPLLMRKVLLVNNGVQYGPNAGFGKKTSRFCPQDYYELNKKHPYGGGPLVTSQECPDSPEYHTAQGTAWGPLPHKRTQKGWVSFDDMTKHTRGTSVGKHTSMMAPETPKPEHSSKLRDIGVPTPNEERLQELYNLHQKKAWTVPGPGTYEVNDCKMSASRSDFRRPHDPETDGPFFLQHEWEDSTRNRELSALFKTKSDSGLGPGQYEAPASKDWTMQRRPGVVGISHRRRVLVRGGEVVTVGVHRAAADFDVEETEEVTDPGKNNENGASATVLRLHSSGMHPGRKLAKEIPPPPGFERAHKSWGWIGLSNNQRSNWTHTYGGVYRCGRRADRGALRSEYNKQEINPCNFPAKTEGFES